MAKEKMMTNIKRLFNFVFLCLVCSKGFCGIENYNLKVFNQDSDFLGIFIYTILQDDDGYLWIGTDEGLHQFDGKTLINLNSKDSTINNLVTASLIPSEKGLLFGYFKGGLSRYKHGVYQKIFTERDIRNKIVKIEEASNNTKWILTQNEGIIRLKDDDYRLLARSLLKNKIAYDLEIYEDNLFVATNVGLIHFKILGNDKISLVRTVPGTEHIPILTLFTDHKRSRHAMWLGTDENGLIEVKLEDQSFKAKRHHLLNEMSILSISEDDYDNLWIGTRLNGLVKIDFNAGNKRNIQFTYFNESNGFPGNEIRKVFVDRENEIWVGTFGNGLVQITEKNIHHYELHSKLKTGGVNCIGQLNHTNLVIGTDNGILKTAHSGDLDSLIFEYSYHLKGEKINSLFHSKTGKIWVGTNQIGIYSFDRNLQNPKKIDLGKLDGLNESVRYLTEDKNGIVWASLSGNGIIKHDPKTGSIKKYNTRNGFYHNEVFHIYPDSKGRIWFSAHSVGIALMETDGSIRFLTKENEIPVKDVTAITEDGHGNIWIATYGQGLLRLKNNELSRFYEKDNLLSDYCNSIAIDKENNVWVSHRKGVSHLNSETELINTFNHKSELGESEVLLNSTFTDDVFDIWFGNPYGITKIDKPDLNFKTKNLNTLISNIRLHFIEEDLWQYTESRELEGFVPKSLDFPYYKNDLTFDFIAIHLRDPEAVHYQFKLDGYDKHWSPIMQANEANYTNLPPGKYDFKVKESDNPNYWQEDVASIKFRISPAYWDTLWFTSLELIFMLTVLVVMFLLSSKIQNKLVTRILIFASIFTIFEYIHTQLEPYIEDIAGGPAIFQVLANLILALILFPVEDLIRGFLYRRKMKKVKNKLVTMNLLKKNSSTTTQES